MARQPDMLDRLGATLVRLAPYLVLAVLFLAVVGICTAQDMFRVVRGGWRREEPSTPASPWPQYDKTIFIYEHNTDLDEFGRIVDTSFVGTNYGYPTGTLFLANNAMAPSAWDTICYTGLAFAAQAVSNAPVNIAVSAGQRIGFMSAPCTNATVGLQW